MGQNTRVRYCAEKFNLLFLLKLFNKVQKEDVSIFAKHQSKIALTGRQSYTNGPIFSNIAM